MLTDADSTNQAKSMVARRLRTALRFLTLLVAASALYWLAFALWRCSLELNRALVMYAGGSGTPPSRERPCGVLTLPRYDPDHDCFIIKTRNTSFQVFPMAVPADRLSADEDGDGLNLREEIARLTSDSCFDSDGDGLSDAVDPSPRGGIRDRKARVLEKMLSRVTGYPVWSHVREEATKVPQTLVYVISPNGPSHDIRLDGCQIVELDGARSAAFLRYVAPKTAAIYYLDARISIPGFLYLYGVQGRISKWGYSSVQLMLDPPLVGPFRVWSR